MMRPLHHANKPGAVVHGAHNQKPGRCRNLLQAPDFSYRQLPIISTHYDYQYSRLQFRLQVGPLCTLLIKLQKIYNYKLPARYGEDGNSAVKAMQITTITDQCNINSVCCNGKLTWYYIEKATEREVQYLADNFHFHALALDDVLSRVQRPKIDDYDTYLFIVLHFPVFDKTNRVTTPSELDIFIGENFLVTSHKGDLKPLSKLFNECLLNEDIRQKYMGRSASYLFYQLLDRLVNYCFPILDRIEDNIDKIEDLIFTRAVPETVREISMIRRDLISFRRIVHPQISVLEELEKEKYPFFKEDQDVYFGDIADHIRKIWDGLEDCKEVVDGLADTSNWLTSHRIQEVMRVLTIVMALMAPATLIASIYGMNIHLPGGITSGDFLTFVFVIGFMVITAGAMVWYFHRKSWI